MHKEGLVNAWEGLHNLAIECETEEDLYSIVTFVKSEKTRET